MGIKVDFHVHSTASSDGMSSLDRLAKTASKQGLFALCISDHNRYAFDQIHQRHGVYLLPACEISTTEGHILALFCATPCDIPALTADGLPTAQRAVDEIHRCGGLAVMAHPFAAKGSLPPAIPADIDGIEVCNARATFHHPDANQRALDYAQQHHLLQLAGSDSHSHRELGNAYTLVDTQGVDDLPDAVAQGRTTPVLIRTTPRIRKGFTQIKKGFYLKRPLFIAKALLYCLYCLALDIIKH